MTIEPYLDTSVLAKWYINEARSADVETFLRRRSSAAISRLTVLEFRCLLARRWRSKEIDTQTENQILGAFEHHIQQGFLSVCPLEDHHVIGATTLITRVRSCALRTLDALHLAIAADLDVKQFVTADRRQGDAAEAIGLEAVRFH